MTSSLPRWLAPAAWYAVILAVSAIPGDDLAGTPGWLFWVGHLGEYGVLGTLLHRAWGRGSGLAVAVTALLLGVLNEVLQGSVEGRAADVFDVAVDGLGALLGVTVRVLLDDGGQARSSSRLQTS